MFDRFKDRVGDPSLTPSTEALMSFSALCAEEHKGQLGPRVDVKTLKKDIVNFGKIWKRDTGVEIPVEVIEEVKTVRKTGRRDDKIFELADSTI